MTRFHVDIIIVLILSFLWLGLGFVQLPNKLDLKNAIRNALGMFVIFYIVQLVFIKILYDEYEKVKCETNCLRMRDAFFDSAANRKKVEKKLHDYLIAKYGIDFVTNARQKRKAFECNKARVAAENAKREQEQARGVAGTRN